jgi:single-strand DNA-binding protein
MNAYGLARLGRDAELRKMSNGDSVTNLSLAFTFGRKGNDGKRPTQWVEGALFGARADALAQYLTKGTLIAVSLEDVHIQTFQKADGTEGTKLSGRISTLDLAGGGSDRPAAPPPPPPPSRPAPRPSTGFDDMDNDIPF